MVMVGAIYCPVTLMEYVAEKFFSRNSDGINGGLFCQMCYV
jgi:hypothetical protein